MHGGRAATGQDASSVAQNAKFFAANDEYAKRVGSLATYRNIRDAIGPQIAGSQRLLDVGNGGVFDYDTSLAAQIVGVDLFLGDAPEHPDPRITLRQGDALALEEADSSYDRVLEISVFHHLVAHEAAGTLDNVETAIAEAHRVLEPGGRYVVMESCVSERAFALERRLFGLVRLVARTPLLDHPATLQFPATTIADAIERRFGNVTVSRISVGCLILQFGMRWPTALTPARPYLFTALRS